MDNISKLLSEIIPVATYSFFIWLKKLNDKFLQIDRTI